MFASVGVPIAGNVRKTTMKHISELPLGFISEAGSGKVRRIVNDSSAATETYLAHQLPDMAGADATPLGMMGHVIPVRLAIRSDLPVARYLGLCGYVENGGPENGTGYERL